VVVMSDEGPKEVQIKDLLEPFTVDEYLKLIFPSPLQEYFVRPVCKIMLEERISRNQAILEYHRQLKSKLDQKTLVVDGGTKFHWSLVKFVLLTFVCLLLPSALFIVSSTWALYWLEPLLAGKPYVHEFVTLLVFFVLVFLGYLLHRSSSFIRILGMWFKGFFQRFLISIYVHRWKWVAVLAISVFIGASFWYEEQSEGILNSAALAAVAFLSPSGFELKAIPSEVLSIANAIVLIAQLFLAAALLVPKFTNFLFSAIEIPYQRSALRARFAEKNLDLIIHPKRPYEMQLTLLENYPAYGAQERNSDQMIEFQGDLQRAKDDEITFDNKLHELFTKNAHAALCPNLKHYEWCLVGLWAFSDIEPVDDSDWTPKPHCKEFAQAQFSQAFYDYISNNEVGTKTTRDAFFEEYGEDGSFDVDKSKELSEALLSNQVSNSRKLLEELNKTINHKKVA
jgi:hypothetical protein